MDSPIIKMEFSPKESGGQVYSVYLTNLKDAIALNQKDYDMLETIRKDILEVQSVISVMQFRLQQAKASIQGAILNQ